MMKRRMDTTLALLCILTGLGFALAFAKDTGCRGRLSPQRAGC